MIQPVKNLPAIPETGVWCLTQEDALRKGMVTHSSILAWRIPWTEEPDGLQPLGHKESDTTEWPTLWSLQPFLKEPSWKKGSLRLNISDLLSGHTTLSSHFFTLILYTSPILYSYFYSLILYSSVYKRKTFWEWSQQNGQIRHPWHEFLLQQP